MLFKRRFLVSCILFVASITHTAANDSPLHPADLLSLAHHQFAHAHYADAITNYKAFLATAGDEETLTAQVNFAQCLIALSLDSNDPELWSSGWKLFEKRIPLEIKQNRRAPLTNPLPFGIDVRGKRIKVKAEYGFGDDVTFAPIYCDALHKLGAEVILELPGIHRLLASLFARNKSISQVITQHTPAESIPAYDYDIYLMSLPNLISSEGYTPSTEFTIPKLSCAGIVADENLVQEFETKMSSSQITRDQLNVGICWRASRNIVAGGTRIIDRNIPLRLLTQLAEDMGNVKLWSVQGPPDTFVTESEYGRLEHQGKTGNLDPYLDMIPDRHAYLITQIEDDKDHPFENTAAAIAACDAFAGCDTVFPNLAAAMGKKTYFLLKKEYVDMRWGNTRDTTPWFANATLLRQKTPGDWSIPITELSNYLTRSLWEY
jgi:hypothetical protein